MTAPLEQALNPVLWDVALEIAQRCAAHELALVGSVLAGPRQGIATVRALGLNAAHLVQDDLRLILFAAGLATDHGLTAILSLARRALVADGLWDDGAVASERGRLWSDASLAAYARSYPGAADVATHAKALIAEVEKLDRADALFGQALAALTGAPDVLRISPVKRAKELVKFTRLSKVPVEQLAAWRQRASALTRHIGVSLPTGARCQKPEVV